MIELSGLDFAYDSTDCGGVVKVGIVQKQLLVVDLFISVQMLQTRPFHGAGTTYKAMDFVAFGEQKLCEVRAILSGDAGDEGGGGHSFRFSVFGCEVSGFRLKPGFEFYDVRQIFGASCCLLIFQ